MKLLKTSARGWINFMGESESKQKNITPKSRENASKLCCQWLHKNWKFPIFIRSTASSGLENCSESTRCQEGITVYAAAALYAEVALTESLVTGSNLFFRFLVENSLVRPNRAGFGFLEWGRPWYLDTGLMWVPEVDLRGLGNPNDVSLIKHNPHWEEVPNFCPFIRLGISPKKSLKSIKWIHRLVLYCNL